MPNDKQALIEFSRVFLESVERVRQSEDQSDEALKALFPEFEDRFPLRPPREKLTAESWLTAVRLHILGVSIGTTPTTSEEFEADSNKFTYSFLIKRIVAREQIEEYRLLESRKLLEETKRILAANPELNLDPNSNEDVRQSLNRMLLFREWDLWEIRMLRDHVMIHDPATAAEFEQRLREREDRANSLDNYVRVLSLKY